MKKISNLFRANLRTSRSKAKSTVLFRKTIVLISETTRWFCESTLMIWIFILSFARIYQMQKENLC